MYNDELDLAAKGDVEGRVLVFSDHPIDADARTAYLSRAGLETTTAADMARALDLVNRFEFDVVIVDLSAPFMVTETVHKFKEIDPGIQIIVLDHGSAPECIEEALEEHVFDYLRGPINPRNLLRTARHARDTRRLILENNRLAQQVQHGQNVRGKHLAGIVPFHEPSLPGRPVLVGQSRSIEEVRRLIAEVAPTNMTVLLQGESGTGKDVAARLIHETYAGPSSGAFIKISCPAVPEQLLESELFGYEAGAFTGAQRRKPGRLELAAGGSAFLDEIGETSPMVQAKLLEIVEQKRFTRLGGNETIDVDTRVLVATNHPLEQKIGTGEFRTDLYFRLNQYVIHMPPLRERVEDIPLLVDYFLNKYGPAYGHERLSVSSETMSLLVQWPWPGNVRELESMIRRYALTGREQSLCAALLPQRANAANDEPATGTYYQNEKRAIVEALTTARWNRRRAAEILGISYNTLRRRIAQYHLKSEPVSV